MESYVGPPEGQTALLNRLRRDLATTSQIASRAIQAAQRADARLDRAGKAFNALRAEVESLALDVAELVKQLQHDGRDSAPWDDSDASAPRPRGKAVA